MIYRDSEWEHGLRCGNEECDHLFVDGDEIYESGVLGRCRRRCAVGVTAS